MLETGLILETKLFGDFFFCGLVVVVLGFFTLRIYCAKNVTIIPWNRTLSNLLIFIYVYKISQNIFFPKDFCLPLVCNNIVKINVHTADVFVHIPSLQDATPVEKHFIVSCVL